MTVIVEGGDWEGNTGTGKGGLIVNQKVAHPGTNAKKKWKHRWK